MAAYDLTFTLAQNLDKHFTLTLLDFLWEKEVYNPESVLKAKLDVLSKTKLFDVYTDLYERVHREEFKDLQKNRAKIITELEESDKISLKVVEFFENEEQINSLKNQNKFTRQVLLDEHKISDEDIENLVPYCKLRYECGLYGTGEILQNYSDLTDDAEKKYQVLWGILAEYIVEGEWTKAKESLDALNGFVNERTHSHLDQLRDRTWLLHWSLFIYFNMQNGRNGLIEDMMKEDILKTIQIQCPHILRYVAASVILNPERDIPLNEIAEVIQQERYTYDDPITEFLRVLKIECDFAHAEEELKKCEEVLENDLFLSMYKEEFLKNAKLLYFKAFCDVHKRVDLKILAEKFGMESEEAEDWVVDLITKAKLDAKIDYQKGHLVMGSHAPTIYQQVIDKSNQLLFETSELVQKVEKKYLEKRVALGGMIRGGDLYNM